MGGACALAPCAENLNLQILQVWITKSGWRDGPVALWLGGDEEDALLIADPMAGFDAHEDEPTCALSSGATECAGMIRCDMW